MILRFDPSRYPRGYTHHLQPISEETVQADIIAALALHGLTVHHLDPGGKRAHRILHSRGLKSPAGGLGDAPAGFPDLFGLLAGCCLLIEVKRPACIHPITGQLLQKAGEPTKEQEAFLLNAQALGHRAGVAWSIKDALEIAGVA